jgi:D-alanine-D-alanine ligase
MASWRVCVLAGGPGGEREVSLKSAAAVRAALARVGATVLDVTIGGPEVASAWSDVDGASGQGALLDAFAAVTAWRPDVVFIAMHGAWGEDGRVQGLLDMLGLPYQGSGALASALAMDKIRAKEVFRAHGLPLAPERILDGLQRLDAASLALRVTSLVAELGLPLVLKTPGSGSSVGVAVVDSAADAVATLDAWRGEADRILVEGFVPGREFTCPVLEVTPGHPEALPIVEIRPRSARFFDYEAKYDPGATDELCPAPIPADLEQRLRAIGLAAHAALGCRHVSRTDVRVRADGTVAVLETNTLPGLTPASLLPKSAAARGLDFSSLVATLVNAALAPRG